MTKSHMTKVEKKLLKTAMTIFFTVPPVYWTTTGDITPEGAALLFSTFGALGFGHSWYNKVPDEEKIPKRDMRLARWDGDC